MPDLVVDNVTKQFPTPAEPLRVLERVDFVLDRGASLAIVGPSGCGKSTLLAIVGTLELPSSGTVSLDGRNPFDLDEAALAAFRSEHIGFVFQEHYLLPQCTVLENVLVPFLSDGAAGEAENARARELLERVGLAGRLDHRPAELSGGERQRAAIARALVREPTLLLADEPTGNLDHATSESVTRLLVELQAERNAILIAVTHSTSLAQGLERRMQLDAGQLKPLS